MFDVRSRKDPSNLRTSTSSKHVITVVNNSIAFMVVGMMDSVKAYFGIVCQIFNFLLLDGTSHCSID